VVDRYAVQLDKLTIVGLDEEILTKVDNIFTAVSVIVLTACFEYRVLIVGFFHLISMFPPWSYIMVTIGLYSVVGLVAAHFLGLLGYQLPM
jgi:hypothetical protein